MKIKGEKSTATNVVLSRFKEIPVEEKKNDGGDTLKPPAKKSMHECPKCGTEMEAKSEIEDSSQLQSTLFQCPKCKNIELMARQSNHWFRLDYP